MKTKKILGAFVLAFLFLGIHSCNKENLEKPSEDTPLTIENLVEFANQRYLTLKPEGGSDNSPFFMRGDGLIDEYTANEQGFLAVDKQGRNTFLLCLRSVEPAQEQVLQIRRGLRAYEIRNRQIIWNHRGAYWNLFERMELARRELYKQYQDGEIDMEQYHQKINELRQRFVEGIGRIRASHAEAFSRSYKLLLQHLENILSDNQWEVFSNCLTST